MFPPGATPEELDAALVSLLDEAIGRWAREADYRAQYEWRFEPGNEIISLRRTHYSHGQGRVFSIVFEVTRSELFRSYWPVDMLELERDLIDRSMAAASAPVGTG
jgi:hypothetical protein